MDANDLQLLATRDMPFGKHKGQPIADLPSHYLAWFAREGFPRGETGRLLALMHELDHNGLRHLLAPLRQAAPEPPRSSPSPTPSQPLQPSKPSPLPTLHGAARN